MGQAAHGVVQMGGVPHAPLDGLDRLIVARRRVGGGHRAVGLDFLDERLCPVAFGRDVHNTDAAAAAVVQPAEFLFIGVADIGAVLGPLLGHGDIRALHVDAVNVSAGHLVLLLLHVGENLLQRFKGQGHGRGAKRGDAPLDQTPGHGLQGLGGAVAGVEARAAVNVHINQAGNDGVPRQIQALSPGVHLADTRDFFSFNSQIRPDRLKILIVYHSIFQQHSITSIFI